MTRRIFIVAALLFSSGCLVRDGKIYFNPPTWIKVKPTPHVDPVKQHYLRVLIVEDNDARSTLPPPKLAILTSSKVREWLKSHCSKGPNGEPEFRIFDYRADVSKESKLWSDTLARARSGNFWFYVENEKTGTEGPLPEDEDRFIQILTPFAAGE